MESTLREWELKPSQQVSLTTDNGSNIVAAAARIRLLVPKWQDTDVWKSINDALAPLADFTDIMSGKQTLLLLLLMLSLI